MEKNRTQLTKYFRGYVIFIILIIFISLYVEIIADRESISEFAKIEANASLDKDVIYRKWIAMHGGVYVPVTEKTQPNKYLNHIKNRDVVFDSVKYTLINPSYMTRQVFEMQNEHESTKGHLTSLKPLRPENKADDWEKKALNSFEKGNENLFEVCDIDNERQLRYMQVLKVEESCLKCHASQGYKLNDVRGGISGKISLKKYDSLYQAKVRNQTLVHFGFLLLFIIIGYLAFERLKKQLHNEEKLFNKVRDNEENLKVFNEKLKDKNEHLVASEEELRATNEELHNTNDELILSKQKIIENETKLNKILDAFEDPMYMNTPDHTIVYMNKAMENLIGSDKIGTKCYESIYNLTEVCKWCQYGTQLKTRQTTSYDIKVPGKDEYRFVRNIIFDNDQKLTIFQDITERKKTEKAINESEEKFRLLFEKASDGIFILNAEKAFTETNESFAAMHGYTVEEMLKINLQSLDTPEVHLLAPERIRRALNGENVKFETQHYHKNGSIITLDVSATKITLGKDDYILAFHRDITERKKVEEQLIKLSRVAEQSASSIVITDLKGNIEYVNPKFTQITGYTSEEAIGNNPRILKTDNIPSEEYKNLWETISKGNEWKGEFLNKKKNNELYWEAASISPIIDNNGKIINYLAIKDDITIRKKAEDALRNSEINYKELFDSNTDSLSIVYINEDGSQSNFIELNSSAQSLLGYTREELLELSIHEIEIEIAEEIINLRKRELFTKGTTSFQTKLIHKNGTLIDVAGKSALINYNGRKAVLNVTRDITLQILHEQELEEAKTIAENANKSKDQFLANMSHELRTPLNAILGFSKLLSYQKNITELQKSQINTMFKSGEHLLSLINDILDMSKIEAQGLELELTETNLIETIDTIFNINKVKADEKDLEFVIHKSKTLPQFVIADNRKLKQLMLNLINNAIKFTADGKVIVRADYDIAQKNFIFEVEDTGRGIPEDMQIQIFEPFIQHTGKHLFAEGTGLGLTITKNIIEMMNGNITLESKPDIGSKFRVQIPLEIVKEKEFKIYEVEKIVTSYKGEKKKILVVDDNNANLLFLVDLLESVEFIVETAENGKIALQKTPIFKPDLILLDYRMPIMNGLEFMVELKKDEIFKNTKVIGVSATVRQKEIKKQFCDACDDFLGKPIDAKLLFQKMANISKIEWKYEELKTETKKDGKIVFPENEILEEIIENAELGMFNEINETLDKLYKNDKYHKFCGEIRKLSNKFDGEAIIEFLNKKNK